MLVVLPGQAFDNSSKTGSIILRTRKRAEKRENFSR